MEYQKKQNPSYRQQKHQDKSDREKHIFFKEVFEECQKVFSKKEFQFFVKCIVPHRTINNRSSSTHRKSQNNNSQKQNTNNINEINPFVLTMPRRVNFYGQQNINNLLKQKKNRRILTTPTQRIKRQIQFNTFEDFQLYKRMKIHQQTLTSKDKQKKLKQWKMYCPQPLFYPHSRFQIPKTSFVLSSKCRKYNKKHRFVYQKKPNQEKAGSTIPQHFIQILRFSKHSTPFYTTRPRILKSGR